MVVNNLDVGGLEKVVLSLLRHLPPDEVETSLVCLSGEGALFGEAAIPEERRLVLDKPPMLSVKDKLLAPAAMWRIGAFLRAQRVDVVHPHNLSPLLYAGPPARLLGPSRPVVLYSEHNQINRADARGRRRFQKYVRLADEVIAVSHDLRRILVDELHVAPRVRVVHNGIDPASFGGAADPALRRELGAGEGDFLVGTAVVLSEQKGIRFLLEAARLLRAEDPTVRIAVGGDGPLRAELERAAGELGVADTVRFLGYRRDVARIVSAFDAYVLPSLWEGLPLALLEALAGGKPIVASRVGGNPEIVEHGENGFLVPPRDPAALAQAILALRRDPALRLRMREQNLARFQRDFSIASMVRAHTALYHELGARRGHAVPTRPADGAVTGG